MRWQSKACKVSGLKLTELIAPAPAYQGPPDIEIAGLSADSRTVQTGFLFAALPGTKQDGRNFAADAVARGAVAILTVIDEPHPNKQSHGYATAGWTVAPATSRIVQRIAPLLGVQPVDEASPEVQRALAVESLQGKRLEAY